MDDGQRTTNVIAWSSRHLALWAFRLVLLLLVVSLLSGCLLASGAQTSTDAGEAGGNVSASFVSAEGSQERQVNTGGAGTLNVIATVAVDRGDLRIEVLDPSGAVVFVVASQPGQELIRSGNVSTDAQGQLRYRVVARDARNGRYQLLYQRQ